MKMMEGVSSVTPYPMKISLPLERHKIFVLHREVVSPHEPRSSSPVKVFDSYSAAVKISRNNSDLSG